MIYYSPTLFETMGQDHSMQLILSGVLNITQLVGVSSSLWTMDHFGRRPLLLWGSAAMSVCHIIIAGLVGRYSGNWPAHTGPGWTSVAFLFIYMLGMIQRRLASNLGQRAKSSPSFRGFLGTSTLGDACRGVPILSQSKGRCTVHMFQLVQQFHYCKWHCKLVMIS